MVGKSVSSSRVCYIRLFKKPQEVINRQHSLEVLAQLRMLDLNDEIRTLASKYFTTLQLPESSRMDASHLAVAVWHQTDYLLTWNCRHLANGRVRKLIDELNTELKMKTPIICTPEELMEV